MTEDRELNPWILAIAISLVLWFVIFLMLTPAGARTIKACMSLMSPDMLFCTDARDAVVLCDVTDIKQPACQTIPALYRSWRGHPERREDFYRKLYGAAQ